MSSTSRLQTGLRRSSHPVGSTGSVGEVYGPSRCCVLAPCVSRDVSYACGTVRAGFEHIAASEPAGRPWRVAPWPSPERPGTMA